MNQPVKLEFFFDCSSPWTYFAFTRLRSLVEELDLAVTWRPILVGGVFNAVNKGLYAQREAMFTEPEQARKLDYYLKDMNDWARLCGLDLTIPAGHPISSVKAMRGAFYALEQDLLVPYAQAVFATYWGGDNPDISDEGVLSDICVRSGVDPHGLLAAIREQRYKDLLRDSTEEVIARGGFGSPTVFINEHDMYFGNDRLPLVEYRLRQLR